MSEFILKKFRKLLISEYMFILKLNFPNQLKYVSFLLNYFGGANAHSNIKDPDTLWPVTPNFSTKARSHSDKEFPLHTDASFEDP